MSGISQDILMKCHVMLQVFFIVGETKLQGLVLGVFLSHEFHCNVPEAFQKFTVLQYRLVIVQEQPHKM